MGYVSVSLSQKRFISDKRSERALRGEDIGLSALATWAKEKLNQNFAPGGAKRSHIFRDAPTLPVSND